MMTASYTSMVMQEISRNIADVDSSSLEQLAAQIMQADKIMTAGAGRSGLMMKAFAMRLMHLGFDAYVAGETVTPSFGAHDLLLIGSGSGETGSLISMATKAKSLGGKIAVVTLFPQSSIGALSDLAIKLPGAPKDSGNAQVATVQPMGSLFEQLLLLYLDAAVLSLMEQRAMTATEMYHNHANLE